jgi:hypothetical protein
MQIRANDNSTQNTQPESSYWTLSGLTGHCPAQSDIVRPLRILSGLASNSNQLHKEPLPDFVRSCWTLSGFQISAQWLVSWESPISIHPLPMTLLSWPNKILVLKAYFLHSKGLIHSILEHPLQVLNLGFEWSKDSTSLCDSPPQGHLGSWIFILHTCYYWNIAPRRLKVALELPLCVVSLEKFVLPIFVTVSSSRSAFVTTWVRKGLRETRLFVSLSTRT